MPLRAGSIPARASKFFIPSFSICVNTLLSLDIDPYGSGNSRRKLNGNSALFQRIRGECPVL